VTAAAVARAAGELGGARGNPGLRNFVFQHYLWDHGEDALQVIPAEPHLWREIAEHGFADPTGLHGMYTEAFGAGGEALATLQPHVFYGLGVELAAHFIDANRGRVD